ncbi:hypothetical protein QZH41_016461 [Actinostola sp. cb2023]|nr:hypothetical protein QZH41_016461 [Actinostola sp. cb2023]
MSDLQREALKKRIGIPPLPSMSGKSKGAIHGRRRRDYSPLSWEKFFDKKDDIQVNDTDVSTIKSKYYRDTYTENCADLSADTLSNMGGAIAVHVGVQNLLHSLVGLAVIDVVEGTAMDALSSMQNFLKGRPKRFKTIEEGIEWSVRSGQIHSVESARISMVGQLKKCEDDSEGSNNPDETTQLNTMIIEEEQEGEDTQGKQESADSSTPPSQECWKWRIDLSKTEQFWEGWFVDMSKLFLSCRAPKLLLLAGIDRLDRELTIGQMQGKFEMQVLSRCGHCVHEDAPDKVSEVIVAFLLRYKLTEAKEMFER